MTPLTKFLTGLTGLAVITTLILPGRQTVPVLNSVFGGVRGLYATTMGTGKKV
jgi:hypothetical protein